MRGVELYIQSLSAHRVIDKLSSAGIEVLSARRTQKNELVVCVHANDRKKAFAILQGSCYNIKKYRYTGVMRLLRRVRGAAGLLVGAAIAFFSVLFLQSRVLRIEVTGSGEYLAPEVRAILAEENVGYFSDLSSANALVPRFLSLPRVHFCTVKGEGGVLTVRLEVSDEREPLVPVPLLSPAAGRVEELVVISGTAAVSVGDAVSRGQLLVSAENVVGEGAKEGLVIARVKISYPFTAEYPLTEEGARLQAELDFGQISEIHTTKTAEGWRVEGTAYAEAAQGFG